MGMKLLLSWRLSKHFEFHKKKNENKEVQENISKVCNSSKTCIYPRHQYQFTRNSLMLFFHHPNISCAYLFSCELFTSKVIYFRTFFPLLHLIFREKNPPENFVGTTMPTAIIFLELSNASSMEQRVNNVHAPKSIILPVAKQHAVKKINVKFCILHLGNEVMNAKCDEKKYIRIHFNMKKKSPD